jgi:hypothetical protein
VSKKETQARKKNNTQVPQKHEKHIETTHGTTSSATQQEKGQTKRPIIQTGGARKKTKEHKMPLEYTIMEDDAVLVAQMVQDRTSEDFDNAQRQRDRIQEDLVDMSQLLEQCKKTHRFNRGIELVLAASQIGVEAGLREHDRMQMTTQTISTFHVTPSMLRMEAIVG